MSQHAASPQRNIPTSPIPDPVVGDEDRDEAADIALATDRALERAAASLRLAVDQAEANTCALRLLLAELSDDLPPACGADFTAMSSDLHRAIARGSA